MSSLIIFMINMIAITANFYIKSENIQPTKIIIVNRTLYKKYSIEKIYDNSFFGKKITFSPLNDLCDNESDKNNAKKCLTSSPNNWWCIYYNCVHDTNLFTNHIVIPFTH